MIVSLVPVLVKSAGFIQAEREKVVPENTEGFPPESLSASALPPRFNPLPTLAAIESPESTFVGVKSILLVVESS